MKKFLITTAFVLLGTAAWAQAPSFTQADTNADGAVSMEEAKAALPDVEDTRIVAADANNDGWLSKEEYDALTAA